MYLISGGKGVPGLFFVLEVIFLLCIGRFGVLLIQVCRYILYSLSGDFLKSSVMLMCIIICSYMLKNMDLFVMDFSISFFVTPSTVVLISVYITRVTRSPVFYCLFITFLFRLLVVVFFSHFYITL